MSPRERNRNNKKEIPSKIVIDGTFLLRFRFLPRLCTLYSVCVWFVYRITLHKYTRLFTLFVHTSMGSNCSKEERCFAKKIWWVLERLKTETLPVEEVTSITRSISVTQSGSWYLRHFYLIILTWTLMVQKTQSNFVGL